MTPSTLTSDNPRASASLELSDGAQSLLRMAVGPETLAVSIEHVREILEVTRLTPLPRTPAFVRGVMNLRGAVVPVIDLSARVGLGQTVIGRRSCIVVVESPRVAPTEEADDAEDACDEPLTVGLLVDAVYEVFDTTSSRIEAVPGLGTRIPPEMLAGMARNRGEVIGMLALARVLSSSELTELIARHATH
jgi:purine-binding chemotaxis protein CheW